MIRSKKTSILQTKSLCHIKKKGTTRISATINKINIANKLAFVTSNDILRPLTSSIFSIIIIFTLNDSIFGIEPNDHAIYLDVKQYLANQRQGTHKSKERSEISGSTKKLGRQKGGGGARRGDINSPVLVGGARVFGPNSLSFHNSSL